MGSCSRLDSIPSYVFSNMDGFKKDITKKGHEIIDISIGDPDTPTPEFIVDAMREGLLDIGNFRYPPYEGTYEFRRSVAEYYKRRFGIILDPYEEVICLIGSKEGIVDLSLAVIDTGDVAIVPEPGYPVYSVSVRIAGGVPYTIALTEENNYLPDIGSIEDDIAKKAKLMYVNYPNNPTGAVCSIEKFRPLFEFAKKNNIIICNDAAYNELVFDSHKPVSLLSVEGAKEWAVELGTLSKSYNMTGWRIGYAVGSSIILKKIMKIKSNTDSGQFGAIQHAASLALDRGDMYIEQMRRLYETRRNNAIDRLKEIGISAFMPGGGIYIWFKAPSGNSSIEYGEKLAYECGVIVTPGTAFGRNGEGYLRIALTVDDNIFNTAIERIKKRYLN